MTTMDKLVNGELPADKPDSVAGGLSKGETFAISIAGGAGVVGAQTDIGRIVR